MDKEEFALNLKERTDEVNMILEFFLPKVKGYAKTVLDAMNYSVRVGGKRLRPMLMMETYRLFAQDEEEILHPFMAAIECIHTYSLVHDDLPAMDNDLLRRGNPTTHAKYGHAMGILAGDALLNYAMELVTGGFSIDSLNEQQLKNVIEAQNIMFHYSGAVGMVGGQCVDVELTGKITDPEILGWVYDKKTCALLQASLMVGAVLAGQDSTTVVKCKELGYHLGMAFQIRDDILDVIGDEKEFGKPIHSDENNEKYTMVSLCGLEGAKEKVDVYTNFALEIAEDISGDKNSFFCALIESLANRTK